MINNLNKSKDLTMNYNCHDVNGLLKELYEYIYLLQSNLFQSYKSNRTPILFGFIENNYKFINSMDKYIRQNNNLNSANMYNNQIPMNSFNNQYQTNMFNNPNQIQMKMNSPKEMENNFNKNDNNIFFEEKIIQEIKNNTINFLNSLMELKNGFNNYYIEGYNYFEPNEVKKINDNIINMINKKVYNYIEIDESQNIDSYETEGKLLYAIGGIARKSLKNCNKILIELFNEYKRNLYPPKKLNYNQVIDRKNLSCWIKNNKNLKQYIYHDKYKLDKCEINKYIIDIEKEKNFLSNLYDDFTYLFINCSLSYPLVEVKFSNEKYITFNNDIMIDLIFKDKKYKVNFCYLPLLSSNGELIPGAKYHVFTYKEGSAYKIDNIDYDDVLQLTNLNYWDNN